MFVRERVCVCMHVRGSKYTPAICVEERVWEREREGECVREKAGGGVHESAS